VEIGVSDDAALLLKLLDEQGAKLHALLTRLTLRPDVAEDLLQDLFLKLRDANGFATADNPTAYAFRTAVHLAFDWRRARRPAAPLGLEPPDHSLSQLDGLVAAEEFDEVLDAIQALPGLCRHVVVMHFLEQQDYRAVADSLGKTEHQVRGLCAKGLNKLRAKCR
jgi:RNA polymerase sigma factor (sigma-70 family)